MDNNTFNLDQKKIQSILLGTTHFKLNELLEKALQLKELSYEEMAFLLNRTSSADIKKLTETAMLIKLGCLGNEITLYAPLYISNECVNECVYCAFRISNKNLVRKTLTEDEIIQQAQFLEQRGLRRIQLVFGEHPRGSSVDFIIRCANAIKKNTAINELTINCAPLTTEQFKKLSSTGITHYLVYQETYHRETYAQLHLKGPKRSYTNRLEVMDRALLGGMHHLGLGVLLGLYDYCFDVLAMIMHGRYLEETYCGRISSVSVPRLRPAHGSAYSEKPAYDVSDDELKKSIAILRITFPYAQISVTTRERAALRDELLSVGVSKMSAESKTNPGGYGSNCNKDINALQSGEQFVIEDTRPLEEIKEIVKKKNMIAVY